MKTSQAWLGKGTQNKNKVEKTKEQKAKETKQKERSLRAILSVSVKVSFFFIIKTYFFYFTQSISKALASDYL